MFTPGNGYNFFFYQAASIGSWVNLFKELSWVWVLLLFSLYQVHYGLKNLPVVGYCCSVLKMQAGMPEGFPQWLYFISGCQSFWPIDAIEEISLHALILSSVVGYYSILSRWEVGVLLFWPSLSFRLVLYVWTSKSELFNTPASSHHGSQLYPVSIFGLGWAFSTLIQHKAFSL